MFEICAPKRRCCRPGRGDKRPDSATHEGSTSGLVASLVLQTDRGNKMETDRYACPHCRGAGLVLIWDSATVALARAGRIPPTGDCPGLYARAACCICKAGKPFQDRASTLDQGRLCAPLVFNPKTMHVWQGFSDVGTDDETQHRARFLLWVAKRTRDRERERTPKRSTADDFEWAG